MARSHIANLPYCQTDRLPDCQVARLPCQIATLPLSSLSRRETLSPLSREGVRFLTLERRDTTSLPPLYRGEEGARLRDCQTATLRSSHIANLQYCQTARLPGCQTARLPECQIATLPHCHTATLLFIEKTETLSLPSREGVRFLSPEERDASLLSIWKESASAL